MYNLQIIESRIMEIAAKKGLSKNKLLINSEMGKSFFDNMKKGRIPSVERLHIIADYLNVSIDYLVGRTDKPNLDEAPAITDAPVTQEPKKEDESEKELLRIYRSLPPRIKHEVMSFMYETEDKNELERDRENYINYDVIWFLFCHTYVKEKGIREKVAQILQKEIVVIS